MTKQEILKIIAQNRDILTPENYKGVLKYIDVFTEDELKRIADYLSVARELMEANKRFLVKQKALYQKTEDRLTEIDENMRREYKEGIKKAEQEENHQSATDADDMLNKL